MAGKGYFTCRGEKHHILQYDIPDGETAESFAKTATCRECGGQIGIIQDNV